MRIHGFAANIEDDITQLYVRLHACMWWWWTRVMALPRQGRAHKGEGRTNRKSEKNLCEFIYGLEIPLPSAE